MSTDTLELPPIDADMIDEDPSTALADKIDGAQVVDLKKVDLTDVALARFGDWRKDVDAATKALKGTVHDLSTQSKIDEAKSLRWRLIGQPRAEARKVAKALKSKLAKVSKDVGVAEESIVKAFDEAEKFITPQIEAREAELEAEREAKAAKERERIAGLDAKLAALSTWIDRCKEPGMTAERIEKGIALLEDAQIDPDEWQEYAARAEDRKAEVLGVMHTLYDQAVRREAEAARLEAQRLENERIAAEQAARQAELDAQAAALAAQERQSRAVTRFSTSLAAAIARVGIARVTEVLPDVGARTDLLTPDEMEAHATALDWLHPQTITQVEQVQAPTVPLSDPQAESPAPQPVTPAEEAGGPATHPSEASDEPDYGALEAELVDGPDQLLAAPQSTIHLCWDLLQVLKAPYGGRFPSHPKPGPEWWQEVRSLIEAIEPRLAKMVGAN